MNLNLFNNLTTIQKSLVVAIASIFIFVSSAGATYSLFSSTTKTVDSNQTVSALPSSEGELAEDANDPKTEECPLDGSMRSKKAKDSWSLRIPLAVMIENHAESRPQSGLSSAEIVYEAVAEGGITRFMAVYFCGLGDVQLGPVRSARTYFLDWVSEYDALYAHVGGANTPGPANALGQIIKYGIKDLNQFSIGFPTFWRDYQRLGHAVATEHTMYSSTKKLWEVGVKKNWLGTVDLNKNWSSDFVAWKFKDDNKAQPAAIDKIEVNYWQGYGDYQVTWNYDVNCNCYLRTNGGAAHMDLNNNKQISARNVIVQFQKESHANDGYENNVHLLYGTTGQGKALFFQDGKVIEGKWTKPSRISRTKFVDSNNKEISLNRGNIWIQTVPEGAKVNY